GTKFKLCFIPFHIRVGIGNYTAACKKVCLFFTKQSASNGYGEFSAARRRHPSNRTGVPSAFEAFKLLNIMHCLFSWKTTNSRGGVQRSEEHTSELQSRFDLVCRL